MCIHTLIYIYTLIYVYVFIHIHTHTNIYVCTIYIHTLIYICVYIHMYINTLIYYTYVCVYTYVLHTLNHHKLGMQLRLSSICLACTKPRFQFLAVHNPGLYMPVILTLGK